MTINLPEVFVSDSGLASFVSKELKKGHLRKLGSKVYTTNLREPVELLVRRHVWFIVKELFPGSVIVDRTALEHRPTAEGAGFYCLYKKTSYLPPRPIHLSEKRTWSS